MSLRTPAKLIRLSKSCLGPAEKQAVLGVLDREYLGMGKDVQEFEMLLMKYFNRPALCVVNGTAALQLAVQSCGLGIGDEILVPSLTYVASFQAILATGARPIACEIDEEQCIMDWRDAEKRITKKTKAIMPVHYSGGVGDLDSIYELARKYNLRVIEDAAHAFGTTYNEKLIGSFGDIACFSFDGIKNITSGEGGCIVATDSRILERIRDARLLGVERDTEKRYSGQRSWEFDVTAPGWRYHMSNIMAAIGIEQLKRFPELSGKRQTLAKLYDSKFENFKDIIKPLNRDYNTVVPHIYVVRILKSYDRKNLQEKMLEAGIQTGIHYQPNHVLSLFKSNQSSKLPITEKVFSELLTLPMHPDLREDDVEYVCKTLLNEVASAPGK